MRRVQRERGREGRVHAHPLLATSRAWSKAPSVCRDGSSPPTPPGQQGGREQTPAEAIQARCTHHPAVLHLVGCTVVVVRGEATPWHMACRTLASYDTTPSVRAVGRLVRGQPVSGNVQLCSLYSLSLSFGRAQQRSAEISTLG
ncbi:hypothetical protein K431DRAFT_155129 [Polychaeton citri CBS 116435]|uniref:Uncharacterized protein n=1 Tax=Polychaeton citri CBS 116435 TaxID=1314669 RepID=A0A9P4QBQ4_9PEZI|nr:hypothetical protein K431DRAFT_155129 [Polychaeton citri CBS 116435]